MNSEAEITKWQDRQARIDAGRPIGELAAYMESLAEYGDAYVASEARVYAKRSPILGDLVEAMIAGDPWVIAAGYDLAPLGRVGDQQPLDLRMHREPAGTRVGETVEILRPGVIWTVEDLLLVKAEVYPV